MTIAALIRIRLQSQHIYKSTAGTPADVVARMGAMQAQDFPMSRWAVGARCPGTTDAEIQAAYDRGDIIRTHVLRPTWHLVAAGDVRWMLDLSAARIKKSMTTRHKGLGITASVLKKVYGVLERELDGDTLTREELQACFHRAHIETDENRLSHLLMCAELDMVICSGPARNGKISYALFNARIPESKPMHRDEALAELVRRYLTSRGPVTIEDFSAWSHVTLGDARRALESVKHEFVSAVIAGATYWYAEKNAGGSMPKRAYLLPAFDEYLIGYRDRSAVIPPGHLVKAVYTNGVFRPIIVVDGQVVGTWSRLFKKDQLVVRTQFLSRVTPAQEGSIQTAEHTYGRFIGVPRTH